MISLRSRGRGRDYGLVRGLLEATLDVLYTGGWPAALWARVPGSCDVRRVEVPFRAGLAQPLRVAFVSDIHLGPTTPSALVDRAFARIEEEKPDVLLLGGDFVFLESTPAKARELRDRVRAVRCPRKMAVLGNHDLWSHHERLEEALAEAGVAVLANESVSLAPGLTLVAIDDPWTGDADVPRAFANVPEKDAVLVLCHSPDALPAVRAELAKRPRPAFYVCGHTHGGHIASPWGPIVVPGPIGKQHPAGLYPFDELHLYVSRGVGATELPVRTYAPPEIVIVAVA